MSCVLLQEHVELSIREVAEHLGLSARRVRALIHDGPLAAVRRNGRLYVSEADLAEFRRPRLLRRAA